MTAIRRYLPADESAVVGVWHRAFLALKGSYVDRLYVDPAEQRKGWGRDLIEHAKALHPDGLELHTHQENHGARAFYESQGFVAVKYGLSPAPELAPDVEYHWRPEELSLNQNSLLRRENGA